MTTLHVELPPEVYDRLREEANRVGKPPETLVEEWVVEQLVPSSPTPSNEREHAFQVLRSAGLLVDLSPVIEARADPTVRLQDVQAALARAGGKPLSEIILDQRGPKE